VRSGEAFEYLKRHSENLRMVFLNCASPSLICDTVMPDNRGGIFKAVTYLAELGHRNIAFLGAHPKCSPYSCNYLERSHAFNEACESFNLKSETAKITRDVLPDDFTYCKIGEFLRGWLHLKQSPTAVITVNHLYAKMLLRHAIELGIKVSDELSIIGGDNKAEETLPEASLSTLEQDTMFMGSMAAELLLQRISNPERPKIRMNCDMNLVVRKSVAPPKGISRRNQ
jgi:DNA-binding LacI/PurR family transcriptional regulator